MNILVITPLQQELDFLLQGCVKRGFQSEETAVGKLPVVQIPDLGLTLTRGGLGKTQFAVQTQHLLDMGQSWDLVICAGAAGALADHLAIGDVIVAAETVEHDIRNNMGSPLVPRFSSDANALTELTQVASAINAFKIHFGPIASGDEDVVEDSRRIAVRQLTGALAVAWEGAGGARACKFSDTPFVEIRGITDGADSEAATNFAANLADIMENIATLLISWLDKRSR
ncbi:MAG: 5'-methylthioadenosine/S-adenosylhomocysteine nucleosidase [Chloroflexi bacterium]|nr:5'-methylthioadenosine/S-adenosylhomocysteine nucleosidase [Chloroflexota bacterium]